MKEAKVRKGNERKKINSRGMKRKEEEGNYRWIFELFNRGLSVIHVTCMQRRMLARHES